MKGHRGVVSGHLTAVQVESELMFCATTSVWNRFDPEGGEDFTAWRESILKGVEQGEGPVSAGDLLRIGTVDLLVTGTRAIHTSTLILSSLGIENTNLTSGGDGKDTFARCGSTCASPDAVDTCY